MAGRDSKLAGGRAGKPSPPSVSRSTAGNSAKPLTAKQRRFALEYLVCLNASEAYRRAGYAAKNADVDGPALLGNPGIQAFVGPVLARAEQKTEVKLERILTELHRVLLADPLDAWRDELTLKQLHEIPEDLRRAISGMKVAEMFEGHGEDRELVGYLREVKFWSKTEASQQLLRVLGAFKDKLEVEHTHSYSDLVAEAARRREERQVAPSRPPVPRAQA